MRKYILASFASLAMAAAASAQISPVGPFTGQFQEGFENIGFFGFQTCIPGGVFSGTANMCDASGGNGMHITGGWGFFCTIGPNSGGWLFGSAGGPVMFEFNNPAKRFGAYMGTNSGTDGGTAEFYDPNGALIATLQISTAGCTYTWNGWESTSANIKKLKITGANPFGGGFVQMDDMEVDYSGGPSCKWDLNGDGKVCQEDLGILLAGYGTIYNQSDLGALLAEYGVCGNPC